MPIHSHIFTSFIVFFLVNLIATSHAIARQQSQKQVQSLRQVEKPRNAPKYAQETFVYKQLDDRQLKLYLTRPTKNPPNAGENEPVPAVVFYHGGAWVSGKPGQFDEHSRHLARRGMIAVQVEYRLVKKFEELQPGEDPTPIRCVQDAKSAMRWIRRHAAPLGIDANRIAAAGGSAGGHLAAFLGTTDGLDAPEDNLATSAKANAMILFNPVFNNGPDSWGHRRVGARYREFSPAHNITSDDCPAIVFFGTEDKLVPVETARSFQAEMEQVGLNCRLVLYEGAGHGFFNFGRNGGKWFRQTVVEMDRFLVELGWLQPSPAP